MAMAMETKQAVDAPATPKQPPVWMRIENVLLFFGLFAVQLGNLMILVNPDGRAKYAMPGSLVVYLTLAHWLWRDARRRRFRLWFDYGFFAYVAAPIFLPIYVFLTRRWRGFITLLWFLGMLVAVWGVIGGGYGVILAIKGQG